jgi:hypothetical protein
MDSATAKAFKDAVRRNHSLIERKAASVSALNKADIAQARRAIEEKFAFVDVLNRVSFDRAKHEKLGAPLEYPGLFEIDESFEPKIVRPLESRTDQGRGFHGEREMDVGGRKYVLVYNSGLNTYSMGDHAVTRSDPILIRAKHVRIFMDTKIGLPTEGVSPVYNIGLYTLKPGQP